MAWPKDWSSYLGKTVTVDGTAASSKMGAYLTEDGQDIWIDDLYHWPDAFLKSDGWGKRVRVTGTVTKRDDMPVFVSKPGVWLQGIPVQSEEELEKARWRILLKDARWSLME